MAVTVNVNGLSACHQDSGGIANATLPDVCKTPCSSGMRDVPYPNMAESADLADGSETVTMDGGNSVAIKGCKFAKSTGDESGSGGGVNSGVIQGEAEFISYSPDVTIEGKEVCRLSDQMLMNKGNTACMGGLQNPPVNSGEASKIESQNQEEEETPSGMVRVYPLRYSFSPKYSSLKRPLQIIKYREADGKCKSSFEKIYPPEDSEDGKIHYPAKVSGGIISDDNRGIETPLFHSTLNPGWLYVYNKTKKIWYEYEVLGGKISEAGFGKNTTGRLKKVHWNSEMIGEDVRLANDFECDSLTFPKDSIIEMAYSPVQWSWKQYQTLADDKAKRSQIMRKFDLSQIENEHTFKTEYLRLNVTDNSFSSISRLKGLNRLKNTLFCCLEDPESIAKQLSDDLEKKFEEMELFISSMQTGADPRKLDELKRNKPLDEYLEKDIKKNLTEEKKQLAALHTLAMTTYQLAFTPKKYSQSDKVAHNSWGITKAMAQTKNPFSDEVSKDCLELLLGVNERKKIRKRIEADRKNLADFLKHDYYQNNIWCYSASCNGNQLTGNSVSSYYFYQAIRDCHELDQHLDLDENKTGIETRRAELFKLAGILKEKENGKLIFSTVSNISCTKKDGTNFCNWFNNTKLINSQIIALNEKTVQSKKDIQDLLGGSIALLSNPGVNQKLIGITDAVEKVVKEEIDNLSHFRDVTFGNGEKIFADPQIITLEISPGNKSRLNNTTWGKSVLYKNADKQGSLIILAVDPNDKLAKLKIDNFIKNPGVKKLEDTALDEIHKIINNRFKAGVRKIEHLIPASNFKKTFVNIVESKVFASFMIGVDLWNLFSILEAKPKMTARDGLNISNAVLSIGMSSINLLKKSSAKLATYWETRIATKAGITIIREAVLGSFIAFLEVGVNAVDVYTNTLEKDYDASAAYLVASAGMAAFGVATFYSMTAPVTVPLLIIAIGASVIAGFLEDTPLEQWIKHSPFNIKDFLATDNYTAWEYAKAHYKRKDFIKGLNSLNEILYSYPIQTKGRMKANKRISNGVHNNYVSLDYTCLEELAVTCCMSPRFDKNRQALESEAKLYPEGLKNPANRVTLPIKEKPEIIRNPETGIYQIITKFKISEDNFKKLTKESKIVFFSHLNIDKKNNIYVPASTEATEKKESKKRYFACLIETGKLGLSGEQEIENESKVGTEDELTKLKSRSKISAEEELLNIGLW